jgi:hypothetical protein
MGSAEVDNKENHQVIMAPPRMMLSPITSSPAQPDDRQELGDLVGEKSLLPPPSFDPSVATDNVASDVSTRDDAHLPEPHEMAEIVDDGQKPPYSYATLIGMAILRAPERKLTLSQIYSWITTNFSYYRVNTNGWQNSIRHNLSLNRAFKKKERPKSDPGKGNYWVIERGLEKQFLDGAKGVKKVSSAASRSRSLSSTLASASRRDSLIAPDRLPPPVHDPQHHQHHGSTSHNHTKLPDRIVAPLSVQQGRGDKRGADTRVASSTDEEVHDDSDKDYDSDNDTDKDSNGSKAPSPRGQGTMTVSMTSGIELSDKIHDDALNDGHALTQFGPSISLAALPPERPRSAIGLQHFANTTIEAESPLRKRGSAGVGTLNVFHDGAGPEIKKRCLGADSPLRNGARKLGGGYPGGLASLDADGIPNLEPPPTSWVPYMTMEDSGMIWNNTAQDPPLAISPRGASGEPLTLAPKFGPSLRPSPARSTGTDNSIFATQRAMFRSVTTPLDFDELMTSPSASGRRSRRSDLAALGLSLDDDPISRACFGSPDKRDARQQYFEHSGVTFGVDQSVTDVFGVDICSVVRRAVESKSVTEEGLVGPSPRKRGLNATEDFRFDSPIKNQGAYFTPPRLSRSDTAYF